MTRMEKLQYEIDTADAVVVGAGAGISASAGMHYDGERFEKYFADFHEKYGITDMYSGGFYPYDTLEEYWAWWSRQILINRYEAGIGKPFKDLLEILKDKDYFVLTTNVDHQFQVAGFAKERLFYTREFDSSIIKKTFAGRINPVLFLSNFSFLYMLFYVIL